MLPFKFSILFFRISAFSLYLVTFFLEFLNFILIFYFLRLMPHLDVKFCCISFIISLKTYQISSRISLLFCCRCCFESQQRTECLAIDWGYLLHFTLLFSSSFFYNVVAFLIKFYCCIAQCVLFLHLNLKKKILILPLLGAFL